MSIESLKAQARSHEQKEEWQKALDQYGLALKAYSDDDQPDIGLYNRVGDIFVRVGNYAKALEHYEKAVELYREATLYNNAIAVCKKIIRHVPVRSQVYLTMGQIRAEQGFLSDARTNFLEYAERMQAEGDLDESFRALVEFCDLAPDDVDLRITVAEQMISSGRTDEGVAQLGIAYRTFKRSEREDRAFGLERRIQELAPDTDFDALASEEPAGAMDDYAGAYGEVDLRDTDALTEGDEGDGAEVAAVGREGVGEQEDEPVGVGAEAGERKGDESGIADEDRSAEHEADAPGAAAGIETENGGEHAVDDLDEGDAGFELPLMEGTSDWEDDAEGDIDLPLITFDDGEDADETSESAGFELAEPEPWAESEEVEASADAGAGLAEPAAHAEHAEPTDDSGPAGEPTAAASDTDSQYVDLGSMIFGDDPPEPRTTRFRVAYEEPSGDELADFQKMLSQFKEKVSENLDAADVKAHHDLGTAYKEMGLLDEAISEFQAALRASADHLPTYELMGQTFMEMGKHEAAVKSLERALKARDAVEDELVGIYYYLARAYEHLGRKDSAVEYYDRVFSLDINFADVTERLRALR